jgi:hypothetical protein
MILWKPLEAGLWGNSGMRRNLRGWEDRSHLEERNEKRGLNVGYEAAIRPSEQRLHLRLLIVTMKIGFQYRARHSSNRLCLDLQYATIPPPNIENLSFLDPELRLGTTPFHSINLEAHHQCS